MQFVAPTDPPPEAGADVIYRLTYTFYLPTWIFQANNNYLKLDRFLKLDGLGVLFCTTTGDADMGNSRKAQSSGEKSSISDLGRDCNSPDTGGCDFLVVLAAFVKNATLAEAETDGGKIPGIGGGIGGEDVDVCEESGGQLAVQFVTEAGGGVSGECG